MHGKLIPQYSPELMYPLRQVRLAALVKQKTPALSSGQSPKSVAQNCQLPLKRYHHSLDGCTSNCYLQHCTQLLNVCTKC